MSSIINRRLYKIRHTIHGIVPLFSEVYITDPERVYKFLVED